jgi:hypothetical protein
VKPTTLASRFAAASLLLCSALRATGADAQITAIRRARDAARDATTSVSSLFGKAPAITTNIDDARDGVAALDGFEPTSYSPMADMPRMREGTYLLVPGTYVLVTQSFCLKPGTFGPTRGSGYLHAEWKGDKAPLVSALIARSVDHPEVPQRQVQLLLWAIVARADMKQLNAETKEAALRLLTPAELLDLSGYKLGVVPDAVRNRVLESVPEPARGVLEAENEMRRLLVSGETKYADIERVAVRDGALAGGDALMTMREGRWSYHPSGFFIRYAPRSYSEMRVDIYYPDKFDIHRDASGRITSVTKPDGRGIRPDRSPFLPIGNRGASEATLRLRVLESLSRGVAIDARPDLLKLARADVEDLQHLEEMVAAGGTLAVRADTMLVREAVHSALARYIGIARLSAVPRGSSLERSLRPDHTGGGFRYSLASMAQAGAHTFPTPGRWNPSKGGATPGGTFQRLAPSGNPMNIPSYTPLQKSESSDEPPSEPDALDKAQNAIGAFNNASDVFGAVTDPAGFIGGQPQGQMLGAGFDAAFKASRGISNAMQGKDSGDEEEEAPAAPEYQTFARPRIIEIPKTTPTSLSAPRAAAVNDAIAASFRMAMALEAVATTRARFSAALEAHDDAWVNAQGQALIYLRRLAGLEMVRLSRELRKMQQLAGPGALTTEEKVREAQRELASNGWSAERRAVARQVGVSDAELDARQRRVLALDPRTTAIDAGATVKNLSDALYRYGAYLTLLPEVPPPWE